MQERILVTYPPQENVITNCAEMSYDELASIDREPG